MYIHDYLVKRDLKASAQAFQAEGKVSSDPVGMCSKYSVLKGWFFFCILFLVLRSLSVCIVPFVCHCFNFQEALVLQLSMPREAFCSNGGRFSGIYSSPEPMRSTQRSLLLTLRFVFMSMFNQFGLTTYDFVSRTYATFPFPSAFDFKFSRKCSNFFKF